MPKTIVSSHVMRQIQCNCFPDGNRLPNLNCIHMDKPNGALRKSMIPKVLSKLLGKTVIRRRADKTNYWGIYNPIGYYDYPTNGDIERTEQDDSCVIDLDLVVRLAIRTGNPFASPDHRNVVLEQLYNGNLVVRDGDNIVWQSGVNEPLGNYYTTIQSDGNMITFRGEIGDKRDRNDIVWTSGSGNAVGARSGNYFLGMACDGSYVGLYKGRPNDIQEMYWHQDATWSSASVLSAEDPLFFTAPPTVAPSPFPSEMPSVSPTSVPSSLSTLTPTMNPTLYPTPAPWTATPTSIPTAAPWTESPAPMPTAAPWTETPTSVPTTAPWTETPTSMPTEAPWTTSPTSVPTSTPWTETPTSMPTTASWTASPTSVPMSTPWTETPTSMPTTTPWTASPTSMPTSAPSPAPLFSPSLTAETLQVTPGRSCSSNPDCFDLDGDCCPSSDGKFLACCDHYEPAGIECTPYSLLSVNASCH